MPGHARPHDARADGAVPLVLVHGAWHGAWCWERTTRRLADRGVTNVVTPTLTGLAERRAELSPTVGLGTHVADVVAVLDRLDRPAVLVGHSAAGLVVREAADRRPGKVAQLVLLDGWVGADGDSLLGLAPDWMVEQIRKGAADKGDGWRVPPPPAALVGVDDPGDVRWLQERLTDQPLGTFADATLLSGAVKEVPTSAVVSQQSLIPFRHWADEAGWPVQALPTDHDMMVTAPDALAELLADLLAEVADRAVHP